MSSWRLHSPPISAVWVWPGLWSPLRPAQQPEPGSFSAGGGSTLLPIVPPPAQALWTVVCSTGRSLSSNDSALRNRRHYETAPRRRRIEIRRRLRHYSGSRPHGARSRLGGRCPHHGSRTDRTSGREWRRRRLSGGHLARHTPVPRYARSLASLSIPAPECVHAGPHPHLQGRVRRPPRREDGGRAGGGSHRSRLRVSRTIPAPRASRICRSRAPRRELVPSHHHGERISSPLGPLARHWR